MRSIVLLIALAGVALAAAPAQAKKDHNQLPPGLQKKADRGQPLPPGWQKKLVVGEPLDTEVYTAGQVVVPVDNEGIITLRVGGKLIRLIEATREIVEILQP